jgi:hypothetical protein
MKTNELNNKTRTELCHLRMYWETVEMVTDPNRWESLARAFANYGMVANADKCTRLAGHYRYYENDPATEAELVKFGEWEPRSQNSAL